MIDLGDLREGIFYQNEDQIFEAVGEIIKMENINLYGIGVNLTCYGAIIPKNDNLSNLVAIARKIGTLETSILPYEDCCTVFTPKHPKTKPTLGQLINAEKNLDREALIIRALENIEKIKVNYHDEPVL